MTDETEEFDQTAGARWIKAWEHRFMMGIFRAIHQHDAERAREYEEERKEQGGCH